MKLHQYNEMMAYLTRPKFQDGGPVVPPEKPSSDILFKRKINNLLTGLYGVMPDSKKFLVGEIQKTLNEAEEAGVLSKEDGLNFVRERKKYYDGYFADRAQKQRLRGVIEGDIGTVDRSEFKNGSNEALKKINEAGAKRVTDKVERFKELVKQDKTPNEAKKIVIEEFDIERGKKAGTPKWMTRGKAELTEEGFDFTESKRGPEPTGDAKEKASKKRKQVIGKGEAFEERIKKEKTKTGFGKRFETAHTANIFQAKKLGIDYPVDALAVQARDVNQSVAEILNEELEPLYKKQIELRNKLKKNNTFALRKELDELNRLISDTVATGGKQGSKAANVLKPIIVDPQTLKGKILDLGFKTSDEVMTIPGATTRGTKKGTIEDIMARANIKENVLQKASDIDRPESAKLRDAFKKFGKYAKVISKPVVRAVSPFVPIVGTAGTLMGVADVAEAAKRDLTNEELGIAYLAGPDVAQKYSEFKESVRGKADETEEFVP